MKKLALLFVTVAISISSQAQHLALYEEFTGENCPPCAGANPALWALAQSNTSKMLLLKYQTKIPSATNANGPYLSTYSKTTFVETRNTYYTTPFAPYGRLDGIVLQMGGQNPGHVNYLTQARIDSVYALSYGLNIKVKSFTYSANNDSVTAVITLTAPAAYAPTGGNLKLRGGFIQTLEYTGADQGATGKCGTNGETNFENVIRQMFPDANGTTVPGTWTANQTQDFTLSAKLLGHITFKASDNDPFFAAWVQNDGDKRVVNAARSATQWPNSIKIVDGINSMSVYPNPAVNTATISVAVKQSTDLNVKVYDMSGRLVYFEAKANVAAGNAQFQIPVSGLSAGNYNVTVSSEIGKISQQFSVVK